MQELLFQMLFTFWSKQTQTLYLVEFYVSGFASVSIGKTQQNNTKIRSLISHNRVNQNTLCCFIRVTITLAQYNNLVHQYLIYLTFPQNMELSCYIDDIQLIELTELEEICDLEMHMYVKAKEANHRITQGLPISLRYM